MFSRRQFFGKAALASAALLSVGGLLAVAQEPRIMGVARFDGPLTAAPTQCDWFDLVAGDICRSDDGDHFQVEDFAFYTKTPEGHLIPCINCSIKRPVQ